MIYVVLFLISFILTILIKQISIRKSLLAQVNERSSHTMATPHGGGIAITLTWLLGITYLHIYNEIDMRLYYALMVGFIMSVISYIDDLYELKPIIRLIVQSFVSGLGLYMLGGLLRIDFGFFIVDNQIITNLIAFLGIIWFINLYNFLDGIDGYAGMEAVFLALAGFLFFGGAHFWIFFVCVLGFLVWNWHKAKIFMGDVGSTLLGYTIAIFSIYYQNEGTSIFVWLILFGLFWFDATLTLFRRYKNGESLSVAHRKHAYQRLTQSGISHDRVVIYAFCLNLLLLILGYGAFVQHTWIIGYFMITVVLLYSIIKIVDKQKKFV